MRSQYVHAAAAGGECSAVEGLGDEGFGPGIGGTGSGEELVGSASATADCDGSGVHDGVS